MRILVTGAAGFIGSSTANELAKQGHRVVGIDSLFLGDPKNLKQELMESFIVGNSMEVNKLDLGEFDVVFHFGNPSSAPMFKEDLKAWRDTILGFLEVVKLTRKNNARLVFASTSSIYGPATQYTSSRLSMENIASALGNLNYIAMRYFSVYGPNEKHKGKYANCLSQFLWDMKEGKSPILYGDGSQTRDFIYIDDIVRANTLAMTSDFRDHIDIGTGKETSFNEIIELLNRALGKDIKPKYVPNPIKQYVMHTRAEPIVTEKLLNFRAKISLKEGIEKLIRT